MSETDWLTSSTSELRTEGYNSFRSLRGLRGYRYTELRVLGLETVRILLSYSQSCLPLNACTYLQPKTEFHQGFVRCATSVRYSETANEVRDRG